MSVEGKGMIYISGRITGNTDYVVDFENAYDKLIKRGYRQWQIVTSLMIQPYQGVKEWNNYMIADIKYLVLCKEIFMLKGWWKSKGARLERRIAKALRMRIIYE